MPGLLLSAYQKFYSALNNLDKFNKRLLINGLENGDKLYTYPFCSLLSYFTNHGNDFC
ncbi:hypothetical protein ACOAOT_05180 [Lacrimispora sp. AGF001]